MLHTTPRERSGIMMAKGEAPHARRGLTTIAAAVVVVCVMLALDLLVGARPAGAAFFPGKNGKIAFVDFRFWDLDAEVYVMDPNGRNQTNLTNNSAYDRNPCYSPDGKQIVFQSLRDGNSEIYTMPSSGGQQTNRTNNPAYDDRPSWQPLH
jgi:hypothetical protein